MIQNSARRPDTKRGFFLDLSAPSNRIRSFAVLLGERWQLFPASSRGDNADTADFERNLTLLS